MYTYMSVNQRNNRFAEIPRDSFITDALQRLLRQINQIQHKV